MANKFIDEGFMQPIRNDNLVCKDCRSCIPTRTDICEEYQNHKPVKVLKGGECPLYRKKA